MIGWTWTVFGLKRHRVGMFELSNHSMHERMHCRPSGQPLPPVPHALDHTCSSWLNQVERWFGLLADKPMRRAAHNSLQAPEKQFGTATLSPLPMTFNGPSVPGGSLDAF
ncbi:hypothetical protein ABZ826_09005 [Streptomyces sp. NPDC047515]|uniref:hypothetical protein n=1 Tax=Streptomyces sp. NPDC047515 TaxID=3155380 RepID=UPI0033D16931